MECILLAEVGTRHDLAPTPPVITGLHARRLPSSGGDTAFANQHLAYETLDDEIRERIAELRLSTPAGVRPGRRGLGASGSAHTRRDRPQGALCQWNFTKYIVGLPGGESEALLYRLFTHATRPEFTYRHRWELDDLVLWDNRSVMHYAVRDYDEQRIMHRFVVKGGAPR